MSLIARLLIALFAGVFGLMMLAFASQAEPDKAWMSYLFGGFCFAIALVCFLRGAAAHFVGGLIATGIVGAGLAYLASMLMHGPIFTGRRGDTSIINAVLFSWCSASRYQVPPGDQVWLRGSAQAPQRATFRPVR